MNRTIQSSTTFLFARKISILLFILLPFSVSVAQESSDKVEETLNAVVGLRAEVPDDARTAFALGTMREGNGIVIDDDGLILTIGYLIMEASDIQVTDSHGQFVPAEMVAYDYNSGFGMVRSTQPLGIKGIPLGDSSMLSPGDPTLILSNYGPDFMQVAQVVDRREFPGYWEYLLDRAIFTAPPFSGFGGAALINTQGELVGVGSLMVHDAVTGSRPTPGNMFVPINLLKPIYDDLLQYGRDTADSRPWLGVYTAVDRGHLFIYRIAPDGPAETAGLRPNDIIVAVNGNSVSDMAEFLREVWASGPVGVDVRISVVRAGGLTEIVVKSGDRYEWLKILPGSKYSAMLRLH